MTKDYGKPIIAFIIALAIAFLVFITINNSFSLYESGQVFVLSD